MLKQNPAENNDDCTAIHNDSIQRTDGTDFDIREYIQYLEPNEEVKGKYICPVCGKNDLSIPGTSKVYDCYHCHDTKGIAKALCQLDSERNPHKYTNSKSSNPRVIVTPSHPQAVDTSSTDIKLARLHECPPITESKPIPDFTPKEGKLQTNRRETTYVYSETQQIVRTDFVCEGKKGKYCPHKTLQDGKWEWKKGNEHWHAYGLPDVIKHCPPGGESNTILLVEGEKSVDWTRHHLGLVTVSLREYNKKDIEAFSQKLDETGVINIVFLYDNDDTGLKKATLVKEGLQNRYNVIMLDLTKLVPQLPEKGDMVEVIMHGQEQGWSQEDFVNRLEQEIHEAVAEKIKEQETEKKAVEAKRQKLINQEKKYYVETTVDETVLVSLFENAKGDWATMNSSYYHYNNDKGCWEIQINDVVKNLTAQHLRTLFRLDAKGEPKFNAATHANTESSFKYCRSALYKEEKNSDHLIAFTNGTLNINDMTLKPHDRGNQLTYNINADYILNAECPEDFKKFIYSSYGEELLELIRAVVSMFLDPSCPYGYFVHLIGKAGTGKGVLERFLLTMLGETSMGTCSKFSELSDMDGRHQLLSGKKLIAFPDMSGFQKGLEGFYELVDNGILSSRALFSDSAISKRFNCRFIVLSVDPLTVENAKDGWERRCIPVPTKERIGEVDTTLAEKLDKCKAQVISWALHMDRERRNHLIKNAANVLKPIRDLKHQQILFSDPLRAFVDSCLTPHSRTLAQLNAEIVEGTTVITPIESTVRLFEAYKAYCRATGSSPLGFQKFAKNLKGVLPEQLYTESRSRDKLTKKLTPTGYKISYAYGAIIPGGNGEFSTEWKCNLENCHEGGLAEIKDYVLGKTKELEAEANIPSDQRKTPEATDQLSQEDVTKPSDQTKLINLPEIGDWLILQPYNAIENTYESPEEVFVTLVDRKNNTFFYAKKDSKTDKNHNGEDWVKVSPNICAEEGLVRGVHPHFKRQGNEYVKK